MDRFNVRNMVKNGNIKKFTRKRYQNGANRKSLLLLGTGILFEYNRNNNNTTSSIHRHEPVSRRERLYCASH